MMVKEEVPEEVILNQIITDVNDNAAVFNEMLLACLGFINDVIAEQTSEDKLVANSYIDYILTSELIASHLLKVFELKTDSIKANDKLKDMLIINSKSILNGVRIIKDFQEHKIKEANPEEILEALIK